MVGDVGMDWGKGSSPPSMLGLRCKLTLGRFERRGGVSLFNLAKGGSDCWLDLPLILVRFSGEAIGDEGRGGGEAAFTRAFFAFELRSFSSSSEVASEFRRLRVLLIPSELRLETAPKDGARLSEPDP